MSPLLSLPREILLEIATLVVGKSSPIPDSSSFSSFPSSSSSCSSSSSSSFSSSPDIFKLAQTCQTLRSVGLSIIYSTIKTDVRAGRLELFLADFPAVGAYIRTLTVNACKTRYSDMPTNDVYSKFMGGHSETSATECDSTESTPHPSTNWLKSLLQNCTRLEELIIKQPRTRVVDANTCLAFEFGCLEYVSPASRRTITTVRLQGFRVIGLLTQLQGLLEAEFTALQTLSVEKLFIGNLPSYQETTKLARHLTEFESLTSTLGVKYFILDAPLSRPSHIERRIGALFAQILPSVEVLKVTSGADCIHSLLSAYSRTSRPLTSITIEVPHPSYKLIRDGPTLRDDFCHVLISLAASIVTLKIRCGTEFMICHRLFDEPEWLSLVDMEICCGGLCDGAQFEVLRRCIRARVFKRTKIAVKLAHQKYHNHGGGVVEMFDKMRLVE